MIIDQVKFEAGNRPFRMYEALRFYWDRYNAVSSCPDNHALVFRQNLIYPDFRSDRESTFPSFRTVSSFDVW